MALPPRRSVYRVGSYAIVYGLLTCVIAFRVHSLPGPDRRDAGATRSDTLLLAEPQVPHVVLPRGGPAT